MWNIKTFRTQEDMQKFIDKNKNNMQYNVIFINNGYALEYKKNRKIKI